MKQLVFTIRHANHIFLRCITVSSVACLAPPYVFTLSHKWHNILKKFIEHKVIVLIFSTNLFETCLILTRIY